ncbi:MAG: hypothetical protein WBA22_04170 [Candidatus Methanofastidiosia archaeon]
MPKIGLNFKKALEINNDLVRLYSVLSDSKVQSERVSKIKEEFVTMIEDELKKLQESKIVL